MHYLIYLVEQGEEKDHCNPPGAIPVSAAEYLWLKADIADEEKFIRLPDPPQPIGHLRPVKAEPAP